VPKYQFKYVIDDIDVIFDTCHLIMSQLQNAFVGNEVDKSRLDTFIRTFIPTFFDIDRDLFDSKMADVDPATPRNDEVEDEVMADTETNTSRGRRAVNGKKSNSNLLRGVLDRGKQGQKDESVLESKETTPDLQSNDEDTPASTGTPTEHPRVDPSEHRWMAHPSTGNNTADLNTPFKRDYFHLYASVNIYCFLRMFQTLYERLCNIKANEQQVHDDIRNAKMVKAAHELKLVDKLPTDYFSDVSTSANYYDQILEMCEQVIKQEAEPSQLEEALRRFYMRNGWQLYSFDKMLAAILRYALLILVSDNKDKSLDIINLFYKDRIEDETTHQAELTYRKQVEKLTKEGDIYRIRFVGHSFSDLRASMLTLSTRRVQQKQPFFKYSRRTTRHTKPMNSRRKLAGPTTFPPSQCSIARKACPSQKSTSHTSIATSPPASRTTKNMMRCTLRSGMKTGSSLGSARTVTICCTTQVPMTGGSRALRCKRRAWVPTKK